MAEPLLARVLGQSAWIWRAAAELSMHLLAPAICIPCRRCFLPGAVLVAVLTPYIPPMPCAQRVLTCAPAHTPGVLALFPPQSSPCRPCARRSKKSVGYNSQSLVIMHNKTPRWNKEVRAQVKKECGVQLTEPGDHAQQDAPLERRGAPQRPSCGHAAERAAAAGPGPEGHPSMACLDLMPTPLPRHTWLHPVPACHAHRVPPCQGLLDAVHVRGTP